MAVISKRYYNPKYDGQKPSQTDCDIAGYIRNYPTDEYEYVLKKDDRWEVFYHLSQLRTSLFNWYDFDPASELLEIGGGFGALTGLFCRKCASVTTVERSLFRAETIRERYREMDNLEILAGRFEDVPADRRYDYIVAVGELEYGEGGEASLGGYAGFLADFIRLLKPNGRILLAADNRYGIRYFCGMRDPESGLPFAGLNQRRSNRNAFSRHELIETLTSSGLSRCKLYYPLPDFQFPQMIYSEDYLPQKDVCERLVFYYQDSSTLVAREKQLYADLIDNQVFEFFANSFLAECGTGGALDHTIYAAVTTDRGKASGFATVIRDDGSVRKKPLYREGYSNSKQIYRNLMDLQDQGISIVPHKMSGYNLIMPLVQSVTFSDYLRRIVQEDQYEFMRLLDLLYERILKSSEAAPADRNRLCTKENENADWGIILKKAYIDMIPFNCFFIEGDLVFFDQEFVRDCYPAKYTIFRALKYIYLSIPEAEQFVPIETMKEKYGLTGLWDILDEEENRFVSENRRYDVYGNFYRWTWIDDSRIMANLQLLAGEL